MDRFRDLKAFRDDGLVYSTSSDSAAKLYDAVVDQYVRLSENVEVGGIPGAFNKMFDADPDFIMGKCVKLIFEVLGTMSTLSKNTTLHKNISEIYNLALAETSRMTPIEKRYAYALYAYSKGCQYLAYKHLEAALQEFPFDVFAIRLTHDTLHQLGRWDEMRDLSARMLKRWESKRSSVYYPYLLGMYAFSLEESGRYQLAEKVAREGLAIQPSEQWCWHSIAHVKDMNSGAEEGLSELMKAEPLWCKPELALNNHLRWHTAIFTFDSGNYDNAMQIYDTHIRPKVSSPTRSTLDIIDSSALLYRLQLAGRDVGDRWLELGEACEKFATEHVSLYRDIHFAMCYAGAGRKADMQTFLSSLREYIDTERDPVQFDESLRKGLLVDCSEIFTKNHYVVLDKLGVRCLEAIDAYANADYDTCFEKLYPVRYAINEAEFGGSYTQRDVLLQLMLHASLKSGVYASYAGQLLVERQAHRPSPFNERYMAMLAAQQQDH